MIKNLAIEGIMANKKILELLSELEHIQWVKWRRDIEKRFKIPHSKWLDVSYIDLPENIKEQDRVFARRVLDILKENELNY